MARNRPFEGLCVGETAARRYLISDELLDAFVALSGDDSPIHVDAAAARARGFPGRVAHGALLAGLVSGVLGTELPGAAGVLHRLELKFKRPCCVGDQVTVTVRLEEKVESVRVVLLGARVTGEDGVLRAVGTAQASLPDTTAG